MRTSTLTCLGLSAVALLASSCAPTANSDAAASETAEARPSLARQCFNVQQVNNFRQGRTDQVFLRVGRRDVYEMNGVACRDLDFANRLAILSDMGGAGGSRLCTGDWARIVVPGSTSATETCRVRISRKLTAEEIEAIPAAHRP